MLTVHCEAGMKSLSENERGEVAGYGVNLIRHLGSRYDANTVAFKADGLSGNDFAAFTRFYYTIDLH
jgi:hypothetical protein